MDVVLGKDGDFVSLSVVVFMRICFFDEIIVDVWVCLMNCRNLLK